MDLNLHHFWWVQNHLLTPLINPVRLALTFVNMKNTAFLSKPVNHWIGLPLSEEETEQIFQSVTDCGEGECSIDEVDNLIADLKKQQLKMNSRLNKIVKMISELEHLNDEDDRKVDEVCQYVKDLLRVFGPNWKGFVTCFSGGIADEPTAPYKVLEP